MQINITDHISKRPKSSTWQRAAYSDEIPLSTYPATVQQDVFSLGSLWPCIY